MESVIAEKYAVALLQVAQEQKAVDSIATEIQAIQKLVEANPDLKAILEQPRAKVHEKLEALRQLLNKKLSTTMENFLMLLIMKKRMKHFKAVADHYERLCYELKGKAIARVLTAMPLATAQKDTLIQK
ncbi:MAG TPA: ATP synthase F1 subunit delta, partial [bacterium]|nr:ATP synthase F1 subunit delta [bacterium]